MRGRIASHSEREKEFLKIIDGLCYTRQKWEVWADLITMMACALANATEYREKVRNRREKEYQDCLDRIGSVDVAARAFSLIVEEMEVNPDQDLLGDLYMRLELGSHWHGQFFTPYNICRMCVEIMIPEEKTVAEIERKGWLSVCDPSIGGGAMLIAAVNQLKRMGVNYQQQALFVGQDIDRIVGMMAYIQLSILGCPGYIVIADTLTNPICGDTLMPAEKEGQEFWYTPFYFADTWEYRRRVRMMDRFIDKIKPVPAEPKPLMSRFTFFFDFKEEEDGRTEEQPAACRGEIAG